MIGFITIVLFISSSVAIFALNYFVALCTIAISIILCFVLKIPLKKYLRQLKNIILFVFFVFIFNLIFESLISTCITCLKIISVCLLCFSLVFKLSKNQICDGLVIILSPLKIFGVNMSMLKLYLMIALNYISLLKNDAISIKNALRAKGVDFGIKHMVKSYILLSKIYFKNLFTKITELDRSLQAKGLSLK